MSEKFKSRYLIFLMIAAVMFTMLVTSLYDLTVSNTEEYVAQAVKTKTTTVSIKGTRGTIMDAKGIPLAYDEKSYNVQFLRDTTQTSPSVRARYTQILMEAIKIIEAGGGEMIDTFNIYRREDGTYYFDFGVDDEEVQKTRLENWRSNMQIADDMTDAQEIYYELRGRYRIPDEVSYEEARKLLSIWQEVQLISYKAYLPVDIAYNVNFDVVSQIETRSDELSGIQINESTVRIYPQKSLAAHIVGYEGRITDADELEQKAELGYTHDDLVGKTGIEYSMENHLTGASSEHQGKKTIEVDNSGTILKTISTEAATKGDDVMLTIDLKLQQVVENALQSNIERISAEQLKKYNEKRADYDPLLNGRELNTVNSGACIVMEVKTGKVLAMVSLPSYDLNLFTGGIDEAVLKSLTEDEASPLFDKTISSKSPPGSIFKLCTAVAGLMEGKITLQTHISDEGPFDKYIEGGARAPACWVKPNYSNHSNLDVIGAIKVSCNYFFYKTADMLGIGLVNKWADNFGLTSRTGIELPNEACGIVGNQTVLYDNSKNIYNEEGYYTQQIALPKLVYNQLRAYLKNYGTTRGVDYTDAQLDDATEQIMKLAGKGSTKMGADIRVLLSTLLDIPENIARQNGWDNEINSILLQLVWDGTDTAVTGIGTSITQVTPIALTRFVCSLLNGGQLLEPHIIERAVDSAGNVTYQSETKTQADLQIDSSYLEAIKEGMKEVVSDQDNNTGGTAVKVFKGFEYSDQIGGKSGTAPINDIDIENNGWFVTFAPFNDPEIVVLTFLPNGMSGSNAGYTNREVLQYWFDSRKAAQSDTATVQPLTTDTASPSPSPAAATGGDDSGNGDNTPSPTATPAPANSSKKEGILVE